MIAALISVIWKVPAPRVEMLLNVVHLKIPSKFLVFVVFEGA